MEIPDFPQHHVHVCQEIPSSSEDKKTVLETVLASYEERNALLKEEKELLAELE